MKNELNIEAVRQLLNRSSTKIDYSSLERLRIARAQALARFDAHSKAPAYVLTSAFAGGGHSTHHQSSHFWATTVLLAALLFSSVSFLQHLTEHDNSDVDIAILTDELPIDVYVD
jgi:hypothetical protein